jgi:RimJ/RimL family protein N-acetyltransferase
MIRIPEIETERLRLRGWREDDAASLTPLYLDDSARFLGGGGGFPRAWRVIATQIGHWTLRGHGMWALEARATSTLAGFCGLWRPGDWPELELGWALLPAERGRGLASEAARAARRHAYQRMGASTLVSYIHPENRASIRVAERLGCRREETIELMSSPAAVFRHPGPDQLSEDQ